MFATTILGFTLTTIWMVFILFLWVLVAIWPAMLAQKKGYNFWLFFLISLFFWWITLFVVLFLKDKSQPPTPSAPVAG
jgi:hypothetical protein